MDFIQALNDTLTDRLLDELYLLTEAEQERELSTEEKVHYLKLVDLLLLNDVHILFGYVI